MKDLLLFAFFLLFVIGGFIYPNISFLIQYHRATKKWVLMNAIKTGEKAYPRSFGGVLLVEYEFQGEKYNVEVMQAMFSECPQTKSISIMVNPDKPAECIHVNSDQVLKIYFTLIPFGSILLFAAVYGLIDSINELLLNPPTF